MLEFYIDSKTKLHQLRQCPVGKYLDDFAQWLQSSGYKQRPAQLTLRAAAHFGHWGSEHVVPIEQVDNELIDTFARTGQGAGKGTRVRDYRACGRVGF